MLAPLALAVVGRLMVRVVPLIFVIRVGLLVVKFAPVMKSPTLKLEILVTLVSEYPPLVMVQVLGVPLIKNGTTTCT